jgi:hypothetical protein
MIEPVEKYFAAKADADTEFRERKADARQQLRDLNDSQSTSSADVRVAERTYYAREEALQRLRGARHALLWAELAVSEDPLIRFIATRGGDRRAQAEIVLRALPADADALRALKTRNRWCSGYTAILNDAIREGLVVDNTSPARRELNEWVNNNLSLPADPQMERFSALVDAVVAAEAADYVARDRGTMTVDTAAAHDDAEADAVIAAEIVDDEEDDDE